MDILYLLVPLALIFFVIALRLLYWAVKNGQYDDLNTESRRILFDEDESPAKSTDKTPES
ncbi:cbb3-type cytochrome oxidase assembly protein CcoS [Simiduia agarivorans]|uniref:Secretion protein HlyD n=1 Tax=Simiduia agarivorans (strain DSM 21679 / JCM 13881 / BCRC 17597 / SA1) TaxID=1117647 RepID=K4KKN9_SIMAS|nr:cbb3-type cytochrome oxidase assembly protein CcoS [Simiduia agarivorans]AFU98785.1 secretion protein HlyD [Simiduia agarivorans SA1 = DSM 21679]